MYHYIDHHLSRLTVTNKLKRSTQKLQAGHPQTLFYLTLLQMGFTARPLTRLS